MIQNRDYFLGKICGQNRLIACGQANGNLHKDFLLTDTAAYIWNQLEEDISPEELVSRFQKEYECETPEEMQLARETVEKFADVLDHSCLMFHPAAQIPMREICIEEVTSEDVPTACYDIAGITLKLHCPDEIIPDELAPWKTDSPEGKTIQNLYFHIHKDLERTPVSLERTLTTFDISILEDKENYYFSFPLALYITQARMDFTGRDVHIFYRNENVTELKNEILQAMGTFFFFLAQKNGLFAVHSASIIYENKAWLFSAPTGVGKSTHTNMWNRNLGVRVFNGDINLIKEDNGEFKVIGIPWCGTSGIYALGEIPLGGIILVKQDPDDFVEELSDEDRIISLLHRTISPMWKTCQGRLNLEWAEKVPAKALVCKLHCTMENKAMEVMKARIDEYLSSPAGQK